MRFKLLAISICALTLILYVQATAVTRTRTIRACHTRFSTSVLNYNTSLYLQISDEIAQTYLNTISSLTNAFTSVQVPLPAPSPLSSISNRMPFILAVGPGRPMQKGAPVRRQAFSFIGFNGRTSTDCSAAASFSLVNGQLSYTNSSGTMMFGTPSSALSSFVYFVPSLNPGDVTVTFQLGQQGTLLWINSSFPAGSVSFCVRNNGAIIAVFVIGSQPADCVFTAISISDISTCPQGFAAGPSGPSGPSGEFYACNSTYTPVKLVSTGWLAFTIHVAVVVEPKYMFLRPLLIHILQLILRITYFVSREAAMSCYLLRLVGYTDGRGQPGGHLVCVCNFPFDLRQHSFSAVLKLTIGTHHRIS
jgi:hypothetical protein